ncbi:hypothetical protein [Stutzerimonas kirkiae]|uniref:hypothetical protein n=1 Tax=Stutzerimonas kirkiae TaxID=2211392 RepID=UPI0013F169BF|nr:hypothetical protein [Stutzerimonas kirkiae]
MLGFYAGHGIVSEIEATDIKCIDEAYEGMLRRAVKYRLLIDMATLQAARCRYFTS